MMQSFSEHRDCEQRFDEEKRQRDVYQFLDIGPEQAFFPWAFFRSVPKFESSCKVAIGLQGLKVKMPGYMPI